MQKYYIKLTSEERGSVEKVIHKKTSGIQVEKRGKVLLDLDESNGKRKYTTRK